MRNCTGYKKQKISLKFKAFRCRWLKITWMSTCTSTPLLIKSTLAKKVKQLMISTQRSWIKWVQRRRQPTTKNTLIQTQKVKMKTFLIFETNMRVILRHANLSSSIPKQINALSVLIKNCYAKNALKVFKIHIIWLIRVKTFTRRRSGWQKN